MNKNFKFMIMAFAAMATAFTSCSKDAEEYAAPIDGTTGNFTFTLKTGDLKTRAVSTAQTDEESIVNEVDVLIFRANGNLEKVAELNVNDFDTDVPGEYSLNSPIEVIAESKKVVIVVNPTPGLRTAIAANGSAALTSVYDEALGALTTDNEFVMVSEELTGIVTSSHTELSPFSLNGSNSISVERLAAKLAVVHDVSTQPTVSVAGGTIDLTSIEYRVDNMNTKFKLLTPDASPFTAGTAPSFKSVEAEPDGPATYPFYMMENIAAGVADNATYARVRCEFTPTVVLDQAGDAVDNFVSGSTFATVAMRDGTVAYFESKAAGDAYITAHADLVGVSEATEYEDGLCDYGITLETTAGKFDVVRNTYYVVTITGFGGIGIPSEPLAPIPPTTNGYIKFSIQVEDWYKEPKNQQLS